MYKENKPIEEMKREFFEKYNILTENEIKEELLFFVKGMKYRRKIAKNIVMEMEDENNRHRLVAITGDRRRGKTTTLLQIMEFYLSKGIKGDEIIYLNGKGNQDLYKFCMDIRKLAINTNYRPKYIFIDEITEMEDLVDGIKALADSTKRYYNRILVTGTWSQIFYELKTDKLLDRVILFELEQLTFNDNKKFLNRDVRESIKNGLYIQDIKRDITYEDSINNIVNYLNLSIYNSNYKESITSDEIRVFYYSMLSMGKQIKNKDIKKYNKSDKILKEYMASAHVGEVKLNKDKVWTLIKILSLTEQTFRKGNIDVLLYQILNVEKSNIDFIDNVIDNYEIIPKNITIRYYINEMTKTDSDFITEAIFEDYISLYLTEFQIIPDFHKVMYKLRKNENEEIDIVSLDKEMLIEVKCSNNWRNEYNKSMLNKSLLKEYYLENFSKNGVYLGETKILDNEIKLWNIYDFEKEILEREELLEPNPFYSPDIGKLNLDWE